MSNDNVLQGHVFKVRHPNGQDWIPIPIMYQTMYQAYVDYCVANNITNRLTQEEYYTLLHSLNDLKRDLTEYVAALEEYVTILNNNSNATLSLDKGGTGVSATSVPDLLTKLGLVSDLTDPTGTKFPNTIAVKEAIDAVAATVDAKTLEAYNNAVAHMAEVYSYIDNAVNNITLRNLNITYGTTTPDDDDDAVVGSIYIKY